jgi:ABC-type branched-subunit amino acid transport system ATPase component
MLWNGVAKVFWEYNKTHPFYTFLNIIFILATIANNFYLPKVYGQLFEMFQKDMKVFMYAFSIILIMKVIIYIIYQFEYYYYSIQKTGIEEIVQKHMISKIKEKYISAPDDVVSSEQLASIMKIQQTVTSWYIKIYEFLTPYLFVIATSAFYMATIDNYLPLCLILLLVGSFISVFTNSMFCSQYAYRENETYIKVFSAIEDYLSNMLTINTYNQSSEENARIKKYQKEYQDANKEIDRCGLSWHLLGVTLTIGCLFLTMYRAYTLLTRNTITKSVFMSIYFIIVAMLGSLVYLSDMFHDLTIEYNNLKELSKLTGIDIFQNTIDKTKLSIKNPKIKTTSLIKIVDLSYKYPSSSEYIMQNLNLDIEKGEKVALIGDIGAGKSTLMKIILGLIKPTSGDIFINGYNYKTKEPTEIFKNFGYMTQNPILFNRSILDNILFNNPDVTRKKVEELLKEFKLDTVFNKLKKGIDSDVGKNGSKLSGGQKQVIWFLRIYLNNPDILLLDEPTASLSIESKEILMKLIDEGFKGKTIIIVSHDPQLISIANRKIKM